MMPLLALMGQPPISKNDQLIHKFVPELPESHVLLPRGPHNRAPSMIIGSSLAFALLIISISARLWVRLFGSRALGADDIVIVPASIGCMVYLSSTIARKAVGCSGRHLVDFTPMLYGNHFKV